MVRQTAYRPAFEDWLFHLVLPLTCYALLGAASYEAGEHMPIALFAVAGSALLLLFVGIHNACDAVAYHVFFNMHGSSNERHKKDARTEKK